MQFFSSTSRERDDIPQGVMVAGDRRQWWWPAVSEREVREFDARDR
jgi:hypothetical protein